MAPGPWTNLPPVWGSAKALQSCNQGNLYCGQICPGHGVHFTVVWKPQRAEEIWARLTAMGEDVTGLYWRYWAFGANYQLKRNHWEEAQRLLETGLARVAGDSKAQLLRNFEGAFVDKTPSPLFDAYRASLIEGIEKGYETGYLLAVNLARLCQREAGAKPDAPYREGKLKEALDWLDLAETTFTNVRQYPILIVYRARVDVLMALRNYRDAIDYIRAILHSDQQMFDIDENLRAQLVLACSRVGLGADCWDLAGTAHTQRDQPSEQTAALRGELQQCKEQLMAAVHAMRAAGLLAGEEQTHD